MVIGYNVETTDSELDKMLDNLRFICTTPDGFSEEKYGYYKEKLLNQFSSDNSNDDLVIEPEIEESMIPIEPSPIALMGGPMDSPWPMQSHDLHHTGQSPYSTEDNPGIEKWRFHSRGWVEECPVIDNDGIVYFGGDKDCLYAINPDGTEKWRYELDGIILGSSAAIEKK